jgi:hypothetical protein
MKQSTLALTLTSLAGLTIGICGSGPSEADAKPVSYKLPNQTATFKPGPNMEVVQNNCTSCIRSTMSRPSPGVRNLRKSSGGPR